MYTKAHLENATSDTLLDSATAEDFADILYDMAASQVSGSQYELALIWLNRAHNILSAHDADTMSIDASELRLSILQSSVKALLGVTGPEAIEKAEAIVAGLEIELGDRLIVLLMRLEVIDSSSQETFDSDMYYFTLRRMIRTIALNDKTFKTIMHHIRLLHNKSPSLACKVLDEFLQERALREENERWVEMILVNRFWMATNQRDGIEVVDSTRSTLELISSNLRNPISVSAAHAMQTVGCNSGKYWTYMADIRSYYGSASSPIIQSVSMILRRCGAAWPCIISSIRQES